MSLKNVIHNILTADSDYLSLLGNPGAEPFQTFFIRAPERPTFPQVIYWFGKKPYDKKRSDDLLFIEPELRVKIMTGDQGYEVIAKRIINLLTKSTEIKCVYQSGREFYDRDFNVYGRELLFKIFEVKGKY